MKVEDWGGRPHIVGREDEGKYEEYDEPFSMFTAFVECYKTEMLKL